MFIKPELIKNIYYRFYYYKYVNSVLSININYLDDIEFYTIYISLLMFSFIIYKLLL